MRSNSAGRGSEGKSTPSPIRRKRVGAGTRRGQLLAAVNTRPGAGAAEFAAMIGIRSTQIYGLVAKAKASG